MTVFLGSWVLLDHGYYAQGRISDVAVYQGSYVEWGKLAETPIETM